jgi:nucleotide-binding universal stress UspA family protein
MIYHSPLLIVLCGRPYYSSNSLYNIESGVSYVDQIVHHWPFVAVIVPYKKRYDIILGIKMELYQRILVPTDGSEYTKAATSHGLALAKLTGAEVTAMFVIDNEVYMGRTLGTIFPTAVPDLTTVLEEEGKKAVADVRSEGEKIGVKVVTKIEWGSPATKIVQDSGKFDLVVMGSLGRTGVSKFLMGSVAEKVVRFAECPVLVVKKRGAQE